VVSQPPDLPNPVLAVVTRSERVESWHRGAIAVWHAGELAVAIGDVERPVFARSATKPFQALPFLERSLHERLQLPPAELVVMCASHDGAPVHTAAVRAFLARGGLREDQLGCGPHAPFDQASRLELLRSGQQPGRVHNNCSGKHTGFLHLAAACGDDLADYLDPACRSQQEVARAVAAMAGMEGPLEVGLDGCGAPTFVLPLRALARAFCELSNPVGQSNVRQAACRTILDAAGREPVLLAGERRLCTALLRCWPGALGIAVKVDDGAERGYQPVVIEVLQQLGAFGGAVPVSLAEFHRPTVYNTQKKLVGSIHSVFAWPA
jgi:L-asparaginase II